MELIAGRDHPLRNVLHGEVHARPFIALEAPERVSHVAMLSGEDGAAEDRRHLARLCERFGLSAPQDGNHFYHDLGPFRLKWERHTEFCTYTFLHRGPFAAPFDDPVITRVPADWLAALPGRRLVALHVALEGPEVPARGPDAAARLIGTEAVVGSRMAGRARGWTDFHIHGDGFGRILLQDGGLAPYQAGRLVQRLLEIETYRMMALLAFPLARERAPEVTRTDQALVELTATISGIGTIAEERETLLRLSRLAAETERALAATRYRFGAASAYYALVVRRIEELREGRIEGVQTIGEFLERRLAPAIRTCESVAQRQERLSERIARASDLLRTRIDVALEEQNQELLRAMSHRARLQLRLQTMIEGISVVAASYYLLGLLAYAGKAAARVGIPVDPEIVVGAAAPVAVALVWYLIHRARRRVLGGAGRRAGRGAGESPPAS